MSKEKEKQFAIKWLKVFEDKESNLSRVFGGLELSDDCFALKYQMDCGESFCEKYPDALGNPEELAKIIDSVTDSKLLGSAIHSEWRYINHWAYGGESDPKTREWFVIALRRLAEISSEKRDKT